MGAALLSTAVAQADISIDSQLDYEVTGYFADSAGLNQETQRVNNSLALEVEVFNSWNDGDESITFKPFYRYDNQDDERSHGDIRELAYIHAGDDWEIRAGIRKEFWGVTEFQHLVDVINQTDGVEDIDGEDKLGQLMLNLSLVQDWGIVDFYLLPGFREQKF